MAGEATAGSIPRVSTVAPFGRVGYCGGQAHPLDKPRGGGCEAGSAERLRRMR